MKAMILKTLVIGTAVGALAAMGISQQANAQTGAHISTGTAHVSSNGAPTSATTAAVGNNPTTAGENVIVQQPQPANNNNNSTEDSGCCGMGGSGNS